MKVYPSDVKDWDLETDKLPKSRIVLTHPYECAASLEDANILGRVVFALFDICDLLDFFSW